MPDQSSGEGNMVGSVPLVGISTAGICVNVSFFPPYSKKPTHQRHLTIREACSVIFGRFHVGDRSTTLSDLPADRWAPIAVSRFRRRVDRWKWTIPLDEAEIVPDARDGGFILTAQVRDERTGRMVMLARQVPPAESWATADPLHEVLFGDEVVG